MKAGLVLLAALVVVTGAAAAGPAVKLTAAGKARANASLLLLADLGEGWGATATKAERPVLSCRGHTPSLGRLVEDGVASSPSFAATPSGPFVVQQTMIFASRAQASAAWSRAVTPALADCAVQTMESLAGKGIKVSILSRSGLGVGKPTAHTSAYRVVATLSSKQQKVKDYFDVIYVSRGNSLSAVSLSSFVKPVPAVVEKALAKLVAARLR